MLRHTRVGFIVLESSNRCCAQVASDILTSQPSNEHRWVCRTEIFKSGGVLVVSDDIPLLTQETLQNQIQTIIRYGSIVRSFSWILFLSVELVKPNSIEACSSESDWQKLDYINATASDMKLLMMVGVATSKELQFCKRRCRGLLSKEAGYLWPQSRCTAHTDHKIIA